MWKQVPTEKFAQRLHKWPKKYKREAAAMVAHLELVLTSLQHGAEVEDLNFGFVHREPGGVLALDQKGGGIGLTQSRLYVYADKPSQVLHVITMGDKRSQADDIAYAKAYVDGVRGSDG